MCKAPGPNPDGAMNIILSGMIAGVPRQGGATWAVLQYLLGLLHLGHEVFFVEPIQDQALQPPASALAHSNNAVYFRYVAAEFGLEHRTALWRTGTTETV